MRQHQRTRWHYVLAAMLSVLAALVVVGSAAAQSSTDLYDPDVRLSDGFYPCPDQTDFNRPPFVSECLGPAPSYTPLLPLVVSGPTSCDPGNTSTIHVQRTTGWASTPSIAGPGWVDGTITWDLTAMIDTQNGPVAPEVQPFPDDGVRMNSAGFETGALTLSGTATINPNNLSEDIVVAVSSVSNTGNWGVCRGPFTEEVTGSQFYGLAPLTGAFYIINAGVLNYDVTSGPAGVLDEEGIAEAYFSNTFAHCCDAENPTGINAATGHFRLQFGTQHPGAGTGGTASTPPGSQPGEPCTGDCTDVTVTDFELPQGDVGGVTLTFDNIATTGDTSVTLLTSMPAQPSGFNVGEPPAVYEISTTATGWDNITVCLPYGSLPGGATPQIKHYVDGQWETVLTTFDSGLPDQIVCGEVSSLSPFAVGYSNYALTGPFEPVNTDMVNAGKAGQTIPVTFSLGGNYGLDIFADGYPRSDGGLCTGGPSDDIETTSNAAGLKYDTATGLYTYHWKTSKSWAGHCRTLTVRFNDGSEFVANFKFK